MALPLRWEPDQIEAIFERQRRSDALGHRIHTACACLALVLLPGPTSVMEFALLPLAVCVLIRLPGIGRMYLPLGSAWVARLGTLWAAWTALTLAWSPDPAQGLDELGSARWALLVPLMWPVLDRRRTLAAALIAGLLLGNLSQLVHAVGLWTGVDAMTWPRKPGRNSGWWDPVVGGTLLCAALGLHVPRALWSEPAGRRWPHVAALVITFLGIIATGTRGAWLAATGLLALAGLRTAAAPRDHAGRPATRQRGVLLATALLLPGLLVMAVLLIPSLHQRARAGVAEVRLALEGRDHSTDTGARILMAWWALEAFRDAPVLGVGAGGYRAWVSQHLQSQGIDPATRPRHAHAHNALLHALSTTGLVGSGLLVALVVAGIRGSPVPRDARTSSVDAGTRWALLGLVLVSAFDPVHTNAQTSAMLWALLALSVDIRPRETPVPGASSAANQPTA